MTIVYRNDGGSAQQGDNTVREAIPVFDIFNGSAVSATGTSDKLEDAAAASGDRGSFILGVRRDNPVASASTNGDYNEVAVDQYGSNYIAGGIANSRLVTSAASVNSTSAKGFPGRVYKMWGRNNAAATRYIKFYNKATAGTVGTDTPFMSVEVPASSTFTFDFDGIVFSTGIAWAFTAGTGLDADTNAVAAGDITTFNLMYS